MPTLRGMKKRVLQARARVAPVHRVRTDLGRPLWVDLRDPGALVLATWGSDHLQPLARRAWARLLVERPWDLVIDVGASYGEFSLAAVIAQDAPVLAVEPNPRVGALLEHTMRGTGCAIAHCFAGSRRGLGWLDPEANSRTQTYGADRGGCGPVVPIVTLDELVAELGRGAISHLLVKIDVEGSELAVLEGAGDLFARVADVVILTEAIHCEIDQMSSALEGFELCGLDPESGAPSPVDLGATLSLRDVVYRKSSVPIPG